MTIKDLKPEMKVFIREDLKVGDDNECVPRI